MAFRDRLEEDDLLEDIPCGAPASFCISIYSKICEFINEYLVWVIFILCIVLGPLNFILYKILFTAYGDHGAYFVSQAVNVMFVLNGAIVLKYVTLNGEIDDDTLNSPQKNYFIMGFLDCLSGFLAAMGAFNVSGASQQLLNQALIPCTMFASYIMLGSHSSYMQMFGAINILLGAFVVVFPHLDSHSDFMAYQLASVLIYFSSNIPIAASYVFKEYGFKNLAVHVIYLNQMVSIYQLLIGFAFAPLQMLPGMGSKDGMSMIDIARNFYEGFLCFLELDHECHENHAFLLLIGYCLVNFVFSTAGLYLVKHSNATLNSISYAIILPITTLAFDLPLLGKFRESFQMSTVIGLVIVMIGFFLWKWESITADLKERKRESLYRKSMSLSTYKRIAKDYDPSNGSDSSDGLFKDLEFERGSFEKLENAIDFESPNDEDDYLSSSYQSKPNEYMINEYGHPKQGRNINHHVETFNDRAIVVGLL